MEDYLDPRNDIVFNLFFSRPKNKGLLISFLNAVITPKSPIIEVTLINNKLENELVEEKSSILDVLIELEDKSRIDVEMQMQSEPAFRSRILLYWAKLHQTQLKRGEDYHEVLPTISIAVLAYNEFREDKTRMHSIFELREINDGGLFNSDLQLHFLELPKLNEWKKKNEHPLLIEAWARFFKIQGATPEEIKTLSKEPIMNQAIKALAELSRDPSAKELAEMREKSKFNLGLIKGGAFKMGEAEGIARSVTLLANKKYKPEEIADLLEMELDEVIKIITQS